MDLSKKKILMNLKSSLFLKSFKEIDLRLLYVILLDAAYYLLVFGIIMLTMSLLKTNFVALEEFMPVLNKIQGFSFEEPGTGKELEEGVAMLRMIFIKGIVIMIGAVILAIIASAVLRSLLWSQILKRRIDKTYLKRFFLLRVPWTLGWLLVIALFFRLFKPAVSAWISIVMAVLYLHFTVILHSLFDKKEGIWKLVKRASIIGTKRSYLFIILYILVTAVFYILGLPGRLMILLGVNVVIMGSVYLVLFFVFAAWLRLYIAMTVKAIEKA